VVKPFGGPRWAVYSAIFHKHLENSKIGLENCNYFHPKEWDWEPWTDAKYSNTIWM